MNLTDFPVPNLVPLPVLLPLLGAALALAFRRSPRLQRVVSLAALAAVVVVAGILVWQTDANGPQVLWLGAWPEPLGISLVADRLSALMLLVSAVVTLARARLRHRAGPGRRTTRGERDAAVDLPPHLPRARGGRLQRVPRR